MNSKTSKYFALILALVVLSSSIGIAQVHHICQLALAGMEQEPCGSSDSVFHDCCTFESDINQNSDDNCCSNEVTYFQNKINTVVQESSKLTIYFSYTENFLLYSVNDLLASSKQITNIEFSKPIFNNLVPVFLFIQSFLI